MVDQCLSRLCCGFFQSLFWALRPLWSMDCLCHSRLSCSVRLGLAQIHLDGYKKITCLACATWNSRNPLEFSCKNGRNCSTTSARFPPTRRWWYFFGMESSSCCLGSSQSIRWFCMRLPACFRSWWWHPTSGIKNGCALRHQSACLFLVFLCWSICSVSGPTDFAWCE